MNKFKKWVARQGGPRALNERLGLSRQAIYLWLWGEKSPREATARRLVRLGRGEFSMVDIYKLRRKKVGIAKWISRL